jgi:hypothetical protein
MDAQALLQQALALPKCQRQLLAEQLLDTLDASDETDEAAFLAELGRRSDEIDRGEAELISWQDLKREDVG